MKLRQYKIRKQLDGEFIRDLGGWLFIISMILAVLLLQKWGCD